MGKIGKDTLAILLVLGILGFALVTSQIFGNHGEQKLSPEEKVAQGVYDPDAIIFAQKEIQDELANGTFLDVESEGLLYLAYMAEGAHCYPDKVDIVRALLLTNQAQSSLDNATVLTDEQVYNLDRVKTAMASSSTQMSPPSYVGAVQAASISPGGTEKTSPVETICQ